MIGTGINPGANNTVNFGSMTKAQLLGYAADHGIAGVSSSMRKQEIIDVLEG